MMKLNSIPGGRIRNFLAGAAVASVVSGVAFAVTSPNFTYSANQTGYLILGPAVMTPANASAANDYVLDRHGVRSNTTTGVCFLTGVNLPDRAVLRNLTVYLTSDNQSDLQVAFDRTRLADNENYRVFNKQPFENSSTYQKITYPFPPEVSTINNAAYAYSLQVCLAVGTEYSGARIQYTYKTAGD